MKKLVNIFLICSLLAFPLFAETITIDTSKGSQELIIPETQEDLREAFIEMSSLYVEERYAYEDLLESSKEVNSKVEELEESIQSYKNSMQSYINDNKILREQYASLMVDYNELMDTMNKRVKASPIRGILGAEVGFKNNFEEIIPSIELGVYLFEKVLIKTRVSYPWEIGLGLGFSF